MLQDSFFFSLNKIILSVYYALHKTLLPTIVVVGCTVLNTVLNYLLIESFGAAGLAASTIIAMVVQVVGLLYVLDLVAHIQFPVKRFLVFLVRYSVQLACIGVLFVFCYYSATAFCLKFIFAITDNLFSTTFLFWFLVGPYCLVTMLIVICQENGSALSSIFELIHKNATILMKSVFLSTL